MGDIWGYVAYTILFLLGFFTYAAKFYYSIRLYRGMRIYYIQFHFFFFFFFFFEYLAEGISSRTRA